MSGHWYPDRVVQVKALASVLMWCSWARCFTLVVLPHPGANWQWGQLDRVLRSCLPWSGIQSSRARMTPVWVFRAAEPGVEQLQLWATRLMMTYPFSLTSLATKQLVIFQCKTLLYHFRELLDQSSILKVWQKSTQDFLTSMIYTLNLKTSKKLWYVEFEWFLFKIF